ncbi:MAG: type II toxin-antitoxin system HipA family toxin [Eggerthellaceae bacterium]|nr:type II toxin-antitoxin system HipA family toxin [Eggerthellaceae bacterium]
MPKKPVGPVRALFVYLANDLVGTLAETADGAIAFQYSESWLSEGYSISPRSLPLDRTVFVADRQLFGGLFGVFNDSLPDGWGALLLDRMLASQGVDPATVGPLERLSIMGSTARGALRYAPQSDLGFSQGIHDLDELASHAAELYDNGSVQDLDAVYAAGGSSGGARPKAYYSDNEGAWLVKFPSRIDPPDVGMLEYDYMTCAKNCGIQVPEAKLFPSSRCSGYFGTKRFDRKGGERVHMVTASGLLEVSHRVPSIDYRTLFQLSFFLTGAQDEAEQLFRRACFNVFAHNHDDHSNNFSWLCEKGVWRMAPAYDLTYSSTAFGEHTTTVMGKGDPTTDDLLALAKDAGLPERRSKSIAHEVETACRELLRRHGLAHRG